MGVTEHKDMTGVTLKPGYIVALEGAGRRPDITFGKVISFVKTWVLVQSGTYHDRVFQTHGNNAIFTQRKAPHKLLVLEQNEDSSF